MNYLVDTNVISELTRLKPNKNVVSWFQQIPHHELFLSVLSVGEIRKGLEKVTDLKRQKKLILWLEHDLANMFRTRIIDITIEIAERWGRLQAEVKRPLPALDSLIAATALHYDMTLVTRNMTDFKDCPGLVILNPWDE